MLEPDVEMLRGSPVRWRTDIGTQHQAACRRCRRFQVFFVRADVADMREGESDDLPGIGRVGQNFLIPGNRGVKADLAGRLTDCADAPAWPGLEGRDGSGW